MKKLIIILLAMPFFAHATLKDEHGLKRADAKAILNNQMGSAASKVRLGNVLDRQVGSAIGKYNFAVSGGAVGTISLLDDDGKALKLPAGAIITNVMIDVITSPTSGGSPTIAIGAAATNDLLTATAIGSLTAGRYQGIPDWATVADQIKLSAEQTLDMTIATAALTAGRFNVHVQYVFSE